MTNEKEFSSLVSNVSSKLDRLIAEYTIAKLQKALNKQRIPRKMKKKQNKNRFL
jgi:hypothetical protein